MFTSIQIQTTETQPFILLPAYVNGKGPFDFVLDTGASMSMVTEEIARLIGIEGKVAKEAMGSAGRKIDVQLSKVDSISIGNVTVKDVQVIIMKELPKCVGAQGDLGYNFVKGFVLVIDYKNQILTFNSSKDESGQANFKHTYIPLRIARPDRPILLVDVFVNSRETYQFILDTGASQTVVSPGLAQQMGIGDTTENTLTGVGGATPGSAGILSSLSIGKAYLTNVSVIVADIFTALNQALDTKLDGILGYNFLSRFKIEIDYPNESLRLIKSG